MERVHWHCVKDGEHLENIVFISAEGWSIFQLIWFSLEASWVLPCYKQKRSIFEASLAILRSWLGESEVCYG